MTLLQSKMHEVFDQIEMQGHLKLVNNPGFKRYFRELREEGYERSEAYCTAYIEWANNLKPNNDESNSTNHE